MNFLSGTLAARGNGAVFRIGDLALPVGVPVDGPADRPAVLGIRPEHIETTEDPAVAIEARLDLVEPMGVTTLLHANLGGEDLKILSLERPQIAPGAPLRLRFPVGKLHLFDQASGERIG